jgi:hypothetical protein
MTPGKPTLRDLIHEAKAERGPDVDWERVEASLFPRVEREARAEAALAEHAGAKRGWVGVAVGLALAAAIPLLLARGPAAPLDAVSEAREPGAGTLGWKDGRVVARVTRGGVAHEASPGEAIALGDTIAIHGGRAVFERPEPRGVKWSAEDGAEIEVRGARGTLILALTKGAIEAQVTPVPNGEAFAIDVDATRVAVHGTHLRVERQGGRAIVDLREGVVSIGLPPKSGATYGDLVTAPAHVEFDAASPHATLKVTHEVARVRVALPLDRPADSARAAVPAQLPSASAAAHVASTPPPPAAHAVALPVALPVAAPAVTPSAAAPPPVAPVPAPLPPVALPATVHAPVPPPPEPPHADPNPEKTIAEAVRACARDHVEQTDSVVITVSSRLELRIGDGGMVESARFEPPLAPAVQACAARAIYGTRFSTPGAVSVPIDFTP